MNELIEKYVKLVLSIGQIDPDYVDAYYGPAKWSAETSQRSNDKEFSIKKLIDEANDIIDSLDNIKYGKERSLEALRLKFFKKQMTAVKGRLFMLGGSSYSFDEESRMLYDATAPTYPEEYFKSVLNKMDLLLSGGGNLIDKLEDFRKSFTIPKDKVSDVFNAAIDECRRITQKYIPLPANESFRLEYVTDKPWSGYNWYKGNSFSLIQVNLDLPIFIERAVELAAHEGYPGHHVYNSLLEKEMVNKKEWLEFTVYPLFSPQSLIAEGTANYGVKMSMPGESRIDFEKEVLFPIAGLDAAEAGRYYEILELTEKISYAGNEAARNYLDGKWSGRKTADWLIEYGLMSPERAAQRLKFIEKYRSYVINYNLGQDIIKSYIEKALPEKNSSAEKWKKFRYIISTPQTPSGLM